MLVERARPLKADWHQLDAGRIVHRRDGSAIVALRSVAPEHLDELALLARFWSECDHPSHVAIREVGLSEGIGYYIMEPPARSLSSQPPNPLPFARVLAFTADLLEVLQAGLTFVDDAGAPHPLHSGIHDAWVGARGRLEIFVGDPAEQAALRETDDVRGVQRVARTLIGGEQHRAAVPTWGAHLFTDNGLTVSELLAAVREAFHGPAAGLMRLDDVYRRLSSTTVTATTPVAGEWMSRLITGAPEYTRIPEITERMWTIVSEALATSMRSTWEDWHEPLLLHMPQAESLLLDVMSDADIDEHPRMLAATILCERRVRSAPVVTALAAALNEPLPKLRWAARRALSALVPAPQIGADRANGRLVGCVHSWFAMEPLEPVRGRARRFCADCARPVAKIDDVEGLRDDLATSGCAFFVDNDEDERVVRRRGTVIG